MTKTTPQQERENWEKEFDRMFHTPNAGTAWGDMTDVKDFIRQTLAQRESEILKRIQELPWSPSVVHPEWRDEVISLLTPSE